MRRKEIVSIIGSLIGLLLFLAGFLINNFSHIYWIGFPVLIIGITLFIVCLILCIKNRKKRQSSHPAPPQEDKIVTVKILGTRTGEETRILATYNFTIYSFLVLYESGKRDVIECKKDSDEFNELIKYIDIKNDIEETIDC